jgi:hypothetical protein
MIFPTITCLTFILGKMHENKRASTSVVTAFQYFRYMINLRTRDFTNIKVYTSAVYQANGEACCKNYLAR